MGASRGSACYREVGAELVARRVAAGRTGQQIADITGWSRTRVARMESGEACTSIADLIHYLVLCKVKIPQMKPILEIARIAERRQGYWLSDRERTEADSLRSLIYHEAAARRTISFEPLAVPGLLQTAGYATAQLTREAGAPSAVIEGALRTRQERQRILRWERPAGFVFFVHEQALRLQVGSAAIMHEQLLHLVLASALEHVTLRVIPCSAGARSTFGGPFKIMEDAKHQPLLYLDLFNSGLFIEDRQYVEDYYQLLPELNAVALDEGESRSFAADLADEYDRGSHPDAAHDLAKEQLQPGVHE